MALLKKLRNTLRYARPFGTAHSESLMNFSPLGSLHCHCEPTDASEPRNDRRRSCRACGNSIVASEPTSLYEKLSRAEIRSITTRLRRAGVDARHVELDTPVTSLLHLPLVDSMLDVDV